MEDHSSPDIVVSTTVRVLQVNEVNFLMLITLPSGNPEGVVEVHSSEEEVAVTFEASDVRAVGVHLYPYSCVRRKTLSVLNSL